MLSMPLSLEAFALALCFMALRISMGSFRACFLRFYVGMVAVLPRCRPFSVLQTGASG